MSQLDFSHLNFSHPQFSPHKAAALQELPYLPETSSQTAGPYVHIGLLPNLVGIDVYPHPLGATMVSAQTQGERISIEGKIFDGSGAPMRDAVIEIWQANSFGRYNSPVDHQDKPLDETFRGFGRAATNFESGTFRFDTIKPGSVMGRNGRVMAPHIAVWFAARGMNIGLHTRLYFSDEEAENNKDPVLNLIEPHLRKTLIAHRREDTERVIYQFDIHLQGSQETVFFDV